jgi:hypothetical protein
MECTNGGGLYASMALWAPTLFLCKTSCAHVQRPTMILLLLSLRINATRTPALRSPLSTPGPLDTNCTCIFSERNSISLDVHGTLPFTEPFPLLSLSLRCTTQGWSPQGPTQLPDCVILHQHTGQFVDVVREPHNSDTSLTLRNGISSLMFHAVCP